MVAINANTSNVVIIDYIIIKGVNDLAKFASIIILIHFKINLN